MRAPTTRLLDAWYADLLGIQVPDVWQRVTMRRHTRLGDYEGYFVVWQGGGAHVSVPTSAGMETADHLSNSAVEDLQTLGFWQRFAASRQLRVIGPSTHAYLDTDPGPVPGVVAVEKSALGSLRALVDAEEWDESGWNDGPAILFGWYDDGGVLVAASSLGDFDGRPRDIGVLVAPSWRGPWTVETPGPARRLVRHPWVWSRPLMREEQQRRVPRHSQPARVRTVVHAAGSALTRDPYAVGGSKTPVGDRPVSRRLPAWSRQREAMLLTAAA